MDADASQPIISIAGEKVVLGPLRRDLLPLYWKWFNDFDYLRTVSRVRPMTWEALEGHFDRTSKAEDEIEFVICYIGCCPAHSGCAAARVCESPSLA